MIETKDLRVSIAQSELIHGISVTIPKGGITAVIGPNGAGKSTLLHTIAGLQSAASGTVTIDGTDIARARPQDRARLVAILTQNQPMLGRLTVEDLVSFGRWPHHRGRPRPEDTAIVAEALAEFALTDLSDRLLDTLSGGQRQRAFVAMAWAQSTPWLFLDEPLNALDPRHARDLMTRLRDLSAPGGDGRSVVVVLHDLNTAAGFADHVIALKFGHLFLAGPKAEVLTAENLSSLFDTPFQTTEVKGRQLVFPD
ncbi:ATP-binding cassette domain-containing protein [Pseudoruegeria sp. HB172150]|uniref:ATP-binding cassette domain-containing protein n=1 Tax=Pseudoruegeria sp. HB172150 TaxID=2721164 RepID=UPI0015521E9F|nr:ATP-binding cassette domain-containing protein [Pseudoruegeria sp. HB172150]